MNFDQWMEKVDELMEQKYGVSIHDLPDQLYADFYESGMAPSEMVDQIAADEGMADG